MTKPIIVEKTPENANGVWGWHFVTSDRRLKFDASDLRVQSGYVYSIDDREIVNLCHTGMHASPYVWDAMYYAPGPVLCRVLNWGDLSRDQCLGYSKHASRHRQVVWVKHVRRQVGLWFCELLRTLEKLEKLPSELELKVTLAEKCLKGELTFSEACAANRNSSDNYLLYDLKYDPIATARDHYSIRNIPVQTLREFWEERFLKLVGPVQFE